MKKQEKMKEKMLEGAAFEVVQRYGAAVREHIESYQGYNSGNGMKLKRSLKGIARYKVNEKYKMNNLKQQAGFAAEVKAVARENAEHIIKGHRKRAVRTDDIPVQVDVRGRRIGGVNDQLFDIAEVNGKGKVMPGGARQMKFIGHSPEDCAQKLLNKKLDKYRENNVKIEIPSDYYDRVAAALKQREDELKNQINTARKEGNLRIVGDKNKELARIRKTRKNLRKSKVSKDEAMQARCHPVRSAMMDVVKVAHKAGMEQAVCGAAIGGAISVIKNLVAVMNGEKTPEEAALSVAKDTGTTAVESYIMAFAGAVVKGGMQNSGDKLIRNMANTNLAAGLVLSVKNTAVIIQKLLRDEITIVECITELAEEGIGEIGAAIGSAVFANMMLTSSGATIKVIACVAGSTLGYLAAIAVYQQVSQSMKEYHLAVKQRIAVEAECEEIVRMIRAYRAEMEESVEQNLSEHLNCFNDSFAAMDQAIIDDDPDGFVRSNVRIQELLGHRIQFTSQAEFDDLMLSDENFVL